MVVGIDELPGKVVREEGAPRQRSNASVDLKKKTRQLGLGGRGVTRRGRSACIVWELQRSDASVDQDTFKVFRGWGGGDTSA